MQTLTKTARNLFPFFLKPEEAPAELVALAALAASRPGLDFRNYCSGWNDKAGRAAYFAESRRITKHLREFREEMRDAAGVTSAHLVEASKRAFSGRLSFADGAIEYVTGQYYPTEYRAACVAVLREAIRISRDL
jgi:hypothetical protein